MSVQPLTFVLCECALYTLMKEGAGPFKPDLISCCIPKPDELSCSLFKHQVIAGNSNIDGSAADSAIVEVPCGSILKTLETNVIGILPTGKRVFDERVE